MSKYLEFKEIPFKGKTKRFEVVSKTSYDECQHCAGIGSFEHYHDETNFLDYETCENCKGEGEIQITLGRIQWYPQWRQYTFNPENNTIWNKDCLEHITKFLQDLMIERKVNKKFE